MVSYIENPSEDSVRGFFPLRQPVSVKSHFSKHHNCRGVTLLVKRQGRYNFKINAAVLKWGLGGKRGYGKKEIKNFLLDNSDVGFVWVFFNSQLVRIPVGWCELHHLCLTSRNSGVAHYLWDMGLLPWTLRTSDLSKSNNVCNRGSLTERQARCYRLQQKLFWECWTIVF